MSKRGVIVIRKFRVFDETLIMLGIVNERRKANTELFEMGFDVENPALELVAKSTILKTEL